MNLITLQDGRVIAYRMGDLTQADMRPEEIQVEDFKYDWIMCLYQAPDQFVVDSVTEEYRAQLTAQEQQVAQEQIKSLVVLQTQSRLDTFAQTRNYDSILSAATYATSTNPKFQTEGQYAVQARDATWAMLYQILAEVEAGTRPVPTGFADIEPELPVLEWPQ